MSDYEGESSGGTFLLIMVGLAGMILLVSNISKQPLLTPTPEPVPMTAASAIEWNSSAFKSEYEQLYQLAARICTTPETQRTELVSRFATVRQRYVTRVGERPNVLPPPTPERLATSC